MFQYILFTSIFSLWPWIFFWLSKYASSVRPGNEYQRHSEVMKNRTSRSIGDVSSKSTGSWFLISFNLHWARSVTAFINTRNYFAVYLDRTHFCSVVADVPFKSSVLVPFGCNHVYWQLPTDKCQQTTDTRHRTTHRPP